MNRRRASGSRWHSTLTRALPLAMVAGLVLGTMACSSSIDTATPPAANETAANETAANETATSGSATGSTPPAKTFTSFRDDGPMTKDKALQVFALAFGPLPDVTTPEDPAYAFPGGTQTGVVLDVIRHFAELTPAQQAAVRDHLVPAAGPTASAPSTTSITTTSTTTTSTRAPAGAALRPAALRLPSQSAEHDPAIDALVERAVADIQRHTGSPLDPVIETDFTDDPTVDGEAWAIAEPYLDYITHPDDPAGRGHTLSDTKCRIHVAGNAMVGGGPQVYSTIAHEVFHCFQYAKFGGTGTEFLTRPGWVIEGGAAWVGEELAGGSGIAIAQSWWQGYLTGAADGSYDMFHNDGYLAIGFWEHVDTAGGDPWRTVLDAILQGDDGAAFSYVTGDSQSVLAGSASSTVRADWPPDGRWQLSTTNQQPTGDHRTPATGTLAHGDGQVEAPAGA